MNTVSPRPSKAHAKNSSPTTKEVVNVPPVRSPVDRKHHKKTITTYDISTTINSKHSREKGKKVGIQDELEIEHSERVQLHDEHDSEYKKRITVQERPLFGPTFHAPHVADVAPPSEATPLLQPASPILSAIKMKRYGVVNQGFYPADGDEMLNMSIANIPGNKKNRTDYEELPDVPGIQHVVNIREPHDPRL